jgi:hypothetical protein
MYIFGVLGMELRLSCMGASVLAQYTFQLDKNKELIDFFL